MRGGDKGMKGRGEKRGLFVNGRGEGRRRRKEVLRGEGRLEGLDVRVMNLRGESE